MQPRADQGGGRGNIGGFDAVLPMSTAICDVCQIATKHGVGIVLNRWTSKGIAHKFCMTPGALY